MDADSSEIIERIWIRFKSLGMTFSIMAILILYLQNSLNRHMLIMDQIVCFQDGGEKLNVNCV